MFQIFNLGLGLGLVTDYKVLRGSTVNSETNSVRVYSEVKLNRPSTYKNNS